MATYFVKTGGSDGADGLSDANAWATCSKVNGFTFAAADVVKFRRGDKWRERLIAHDSGVVGSPIIYTCYGTGALPIFDGSDIKTGWATATAPRYSVSLTTECQLLFVDGVVATKGASESTLNNGEWFWASNLLYYRSDAGNPDTVNLLMEATQRESSGNEGLINFNGKSYVTFDALRAQKSNAFGVHSYAAGSGQAGKTVRNCEVAYCADGGIGIIADSFYFTDTIVEWCEVSYTNLQGNGDGSAALEGITLMHADGFVVRYNRVHHCYEEGIDTHGQSKNGRVHDNWVHTHLGSLSFRPGIYADGNDNVEVDHNLVHGYFANTCVGYQLNNEQAGHSSNNVRFHHNVAWDCALGFTIDNLGGNGHANVKVDHNVFYQCTNGVYFNSRILNQLSGTNSMRNNIFVSSTNQDIRDDSTGNYGINNFVIDTNFFVTGSPTETTGNNAVIATSPLFVDESTKDFRLQWNSPCVNAGLVIAGVNDGYIGSAPDIGAFEQSPGRGGAESRDAVEGPMKTPMSGGIF